MQYFECDSTQCWTSDKWQLPISGVSVEISNWYIYVHVKLYMYVHKICKEGYNREVGPYQVTCFLMAQSNRHFIINHSVTLILWLYYLPSFHDLKHVKVFLKQTGLMVLYFTMLYGLVIQLTRIDLMKIQPIVCGSDTMATITYHAHFM